MTSLIAKVASAALFVVAALPAIAVTMAHAEPATIRMSDLNLAKASNVAEFHARVDRAAQKFCTGSVDLRNLNQMAACRDGVRAEAQSKLNEVQASQVASIAVASR